MYVFLYNSISNYFTTIFNLQKHNTLKYNTILYPRCLGYAYLCLLDSYATFGFHSHSALGRVLYILTLQTHPQKLMVIFPCRMWPLIPWLKFYYPPCAKIAMWFNTCGTWVGLLSSKQKCLLGKKSMNHIFWISFVCLFVCKWVQCRMNKWLDKVQCTKAFMKEMVL